MTVFLILAGSLACGFFLYVLVKFHGESKRLNTPKKYLRERTSEAQANLEREKPRNIATGRSSRMEFRSMGKSGEIQQFRLTLRAATLRESNTEAVARREAWFSVNLGVCGLAALFAGIEIFNLIMMWSH